jgi:hypothetical protein
MMKYDYDVDYTGVFAEQVLREVEDEIQKRSAAMKKAPAQVLKAWKAETHAVKYVWIKAPVRGLDDDGNPINEFKVNVIMRKMFVSALIGHMRGHLLGPIRSPKLTLGMDRGDLKLELSWS